MPDREKVIKALEYCITGDCGSCFYRQQCIKTGIKRDALALLKEQEDLGTELTNAVELIHKKNERIEKLLKEQKFLVDSDGEITPLPVVVRCKDCKHRGDRKKCIVAFVAEKQEMPYFFYDNRGEWFCADGKRR